MLICLSASLVEGGGGGGPGSMQLARFAMKLQLGVADPATSRSAMHRGLGAKGVKEESFGLRRPAGSLCLFPDDCSFFLFRLLMMTMGCTRVGIASISGRSPSVSGRPPPRCSVVRRAYEVCAHGAHLAFVYTLLKCVCSIRRGPLPPRAPGSPRPSGPPPPPLAAPCRPSSAGSCA